MIPEAKRINEVLDMLKEKLDRDFSSKLKIIILDKEGRIEDYRTDHQNGAIIIHYDGSRFVNSLKANIIHNDRLMRPVTLIQIRKEKGARFFYDIIDDTLLSLAGLKFKTIDKMDRVKPTSEEYLTPEKEDQLTFYEQPIVWEVPARFQEVNYLTEPQQ